uniref:protein-tyrosine-phosphatase n=1 Tax=Trichuris muris TaxID=70415 RepID=A0A5S6QT60_TRIMR
MIRFGSGTYNVRESEMTGESNRILHRPIFCDVHFLDGTQHAFEVEKHALGQELLERVYDHLELIEKDYFGLQFTDLSPDPGAMRWLEPAKSIRKQMQCPPYILHFRVKFYVSDPSKLLEEYTRYHFYLQLRKDIADGRLVCSESSFVVLASYAVQSEFGDHSSEEHREGYLEKFSFAPNQTPEFLRKVAELHKQHRGQTPADAEYNFLDHAKRLDLYGVDLYRAQDSSMSDVQVGVASFGVGVFQRAAKLKTFFWPRIMKLSFKRKQFFIQLKSDANSSDMIQCFTLSSTRTSKMLWKSCIEHHTFFRLISPPAPSAKALFTFGSQFRYSGRTEHQTLEEMKKRARIGKTFCRLSSTNCFARSTIASSSYARSQELARKLKPTTSVDAAAVMACHRAPSSLSELIPSPSSSDGNSNNNNNNNGNANAGKSDGLLTGRRMPVETTFGLMDATVDSDGVVEQTYELPGVVHGSDGSTGGGGQSSSRMVPNSLPLIYSIKEQKNLRSSLRHTCHKRVSALLLHQRQQGAGRPVDFKDALVYQHCTTASTSTASPVVCRPSGGRCGTVLASPGHSSVARNGCSPSTALFNGFHSSLGDDGTLVSIRMRPDSQGRFGFNVKGGCDQNYPIIVSRVIPGSPADTCLPRLNEGDQVLAINRVEVSQCTHEQVVRYIRSCKETASKELSLIVRPNAYIGEDIEEPDQLYVPQTPHVADCVPRPDILNQSLLLLKDSLASGSALLYFDKLYRKSPLMTMSIAKYPENLCKNRYRDISPYDKTRVVIQNGICGDYINASFINMEVPSSGIVNRYIAAQGPLPHTTADFWQVVWEQLCHTVVMLTATVERGRVKCHQYWPNLYETHHYGRLEVTCVKEMDTYIGAVRELSVICNETKEERLISHMQYSAWPDHGVPDDPSELIDFIVDVRRSRTGMVEPVLVHCSAGIGRTGVLILLETAMCLIESSEPIYPLEIVKSMRDQRAMLIQNAAQYKFACEAILKIYSEGIVKPLDEYLR